MNIESYHHRIQVVCPLSDCYFVTGRRVERGLISKCRVCELWACMYSLPLLPAFSFSLGLWGHFAKTWVSLQTTTGTYKSKSTKYFDILLLLTCEEVLHAPTVQVWAQNTTILPPNNLLAVFHSSITNWSQNTLSKLKVNFPISGRYAGILSFNYERVFYDQFVMEGGLGVRWWNFELKFKQNVHGGPPHQ